MNAPAEMRRGWCPDMLRPMQTADGLLVRIHPRHAALSAAQAHAIADGARRFGNGLLDLSSRGNLQIRGVTGQTHEPLVESLIGAGLLKGMRHESPFRLATVSPLAGIDPGEFIDSLALAEEVEVAGIDLSGLHPKFSIVVDGGGSVPLDSVDADIRIAALDNDRLALGLARRDRATWTGTVASQAAASAVARILAMMSGDGLYAGLRMRDVPDRDFTILTRDLPPEKAGTPEIRLHAMHAGPLSTDGIDSLFLVPPFGRCSAEAFSAAASWSEEFGRGEIRLSPFRALVIPFMSSFRIVTALAAAAGFIVDRNDPRLSVSACTGMAGCDRGSTATHADAGRIAETLGGLSGMAVHVSGCAKGCAHPAAADLTLVAEAGTYQVVLDGTARDKPVSRAGIDAIVAGLATCNSRADLMRIFETGQP